MDRKIEEARQEFNTILDFVVVEARGREIHEAEGRLFRRLLKLGKKLLEVFIRAAGTGNVGQTLTVEDGTIFRYLRNSARKYLSIFGEIEIVRAYYAKEGKKGIFPLDAALNLPERKYSYVLQEWMSSRAVEESYERAAAWLNKRLYLDLAHRPIQEVVRDCTSTAEEFMESLEPPKPETEGTILVHTVDCKGVKMRPDHRNPDLVKTAEKPGEKRMACVARTYSIGPHLRDKEAIVAGFFGPPNPKTPKTKDPRRPKPLNRRTFVSLRDKKSDLFQRSEKSAKSRIHGGTEEKLVIQDGEKVLWNLSAQLFPGWTEVLDLTHVVEKLRIAGELHYGKRGAAEDYGRERTSLLLKGCVGDVLEDLQAALEDGTLSSAKADELKKKVVGYFQNNRHRMAYDEFLAKGLPIASGIIESTCNCLINIRMEGAGMFWSEDGAEAMLKLRGVLLDELWDEFWQFRAKTEKKKLYEKYGNICVAGQEQVQIRKVA